MRYTSAEASKLLKKLNGDYQELLSREILSRSFLAATGEDVDSVRPEYDFEKTQAEIAEISEKIRRLRHAINVFNTTHEVPGFGMTVDEMLVFLPQLSERASALDSMRAALPKQRERTYGSGTGATIDYRYANYDIKKAAGEYERVYDTLTKAQMALDRLNGSETMEIDI